MSKTAWAGGTLIILFFVGVAVVQHFGMEPQTISKITLSAFRDPDQVASAVWSSIYGELAASQSTKVLIAIDPKDDAERAVAQALIRVMTATPPTATFPGSWALVAQPAGPEEAAIILQNEGAKMIVPLSFFEGVSFLDGSTAHHLIEKGIHNFRTILMSKFPRTRDEEKVFPVPCSVADKDFNGTGEVGCAILQISRVNYRKKLKPNPYLGVMDQISGNDYLLLINASDKLPNSEASSPDTDPKK